MKISFSLRTVSSILKSKAFTLLELSIVLLIIGVIAGGGLVILSAATQSQQANTTIARMDAIDKALLNYSMSFKHLPCPSSLTTTPSSSNYGGAPTTSDCLGGAGSWTYLVPEDGAFVQAGTVRYGYGSSWNTLTFTSGGICSNGVFGDPIFGQIKHCEIYNPPSSLAASFAAASGTVEGGIPVRVLNLSDDFLYDGWGKRLRYAVDPNYVAANSLPVHAGGACILSAKTITVKDATGATRTNSAVYALISHGKNGHGAYTKSGVAINGASTNTDEQQNCHCDATGVGGTYTPTYVQKQSTSNAVTPTDSFDDIVSFKENWQMQTPAFPLTTSCPDYFYVTEWSTNAVSKFDSSGNLLFQFGSSGSGDGQFDSVHAIVTDSYNNLWVSDFNNNRLEKFTSTGTYITKINLGYTPVAVAIDSAGNLWVVNLYGNSIHKYNSAGVQQTQFGTSGSGDGQFNNPWGLAIDSGGNLLVTDGANNRVQKFNSSGVYQSQFGTAGSGNGQFANPTGIAVDSSGNIWVVDSGNNRVQKFTSGGVYISKFGSAGSGNGQFNQPQYVYIDSSSNMWIGDFGNNRAQKFDITGTWIQNINSGNASVGIASSH